MNPVPELPTLGEIFGAGLDQLTAGSLLVTVLELVERLLVEATDAVRWALFALVLGGKA